MLNGPTAAPLSLVVVMLLSLSTLAGCAGSTRPAVLPPSGPGSGASA